jgi:lysophospholipase L1-like esterase
LRRTSPPRAGRALHRRGVSHVRARRLDRDRFRLLDAARGGDAHPPRDLTSSRDKALLAVFGVVVALVLTEGALRLAGYAVSGEQRRRNAAAETDTGAYRILALGESTTASYFVEGNANDWPAQLERILNERSHGRRFVVFNEGVGGTTSAFIVAALRDNLDRYRPDMVVTMMGVNDHELNLRFDDSFAARAALFFNHLRIVKLARQAYEAVRASAPSNARHAPAERPPVSAKHLADAAFVDEIAKGMDAFGEGHVAEGEQIFRDALARHPDNSIFYAELGRMYQNTGHKDEAVAAFARAHELDPEDADVPAEPRRRVRADRTVAGLRHDAGDMAPADPRHRPVRGARAQSPDGVQATPRRADGIDRLARAVTRTDG